MFNKTFYELRAERFGFFTPSETIENILFCLGANHYDMFYHTVYHPHTWFKEVKYVILHRLMFCSSKSYLLQKQTAVVFLCSGV